jgi:predicted transcriptional regulator
VKLGELERQVMDVLWEHPAQERSGREVADALPVYAYTTVATVLDRLTHKGLVARRKDGRIIRFRSLDTGSGLAAQAIRDALDTADDPADALARFVENARPAEVDALRRALRARRVDRS